VYSHAGRARAELGLVLDTGDVVLDLACGDAVSRTSPGARLLRRRRDPRWSRPHEARATCRAGDLTSSSRRASAGDDDLPRDSTTHATVAHCLRASGRYGEEARLRLNPRSTDLPTCGPISPLPASTGGAEAVLRPATVYSRGESSLGVERARHRWPFGMPDVQQSQWASGFHGLSSDHDPLFTSTMAGGIAGAKYRGDQIHSHLPYASVYRKADQHDSAEYLTTCSFGTSSTGSASWTTQDVLQRAIAFTPRSRQKHRTSKAVVLRPNGRLAHFAWRSDCNGLYS